jgi:hypothetical protein
LYRYLCYYLDDAVNVAFEKPTEMSSILNVYESKFGVDGDRHQSLRYKTCFHTLEEDNPWWRVDLAGIYVIFAIRLFNRLDCCSKYADILFL